MDTTAPASLLTELEVAIEGGSSERRIEMLRRMTDLFVETAPRVNDAQAGVFDDVFEQLTKEIESKAVLELSERMSELDKAPDRLIRRLAHDDSIAISGPVLARSGQIAEADLIAIARTKSQEHLHAIAGRSEICEQVTGLLIERGDMEVARKVAANNGARFSEMSLRNLIDRASDDGDLANAVARRRELPPALFRGLLTRATDQVRKRLLDTAQPGTAKVINKILAEVSQGVERATAPKRDYTAAMQAVMEMQKQAPLEAQTLLQLAKAKKTPETLVALSLMTGVSLDVIDRLLDDPADDPILIMCKAIDLDWPVSHAVLSAKLGTQPLRESRAAEAAKKYRKLSTYSAQRVLRFWQAREKVAQAG